VLGVRGVIPLLLVFAGLLVFVAGTAAVGVVHAVRLGHRLARLGNTIQVAQNQVTDGQLSAAQATLAADEAELASINSTLYTSPDFRLLAILPVARQNIQAVRSSVQLGLKLLGDGQQVFASATSVVAPDGRLAVSLKGGQAPTQAIEGVGSVLRSIVPDLPTSADPPHHNFLVGRVRDGEKKVWTEAFKRRKELISVNDGLTILDGLTSGHGDRRFLIAVANTAEMRGAGGMILSYGVLEANNGKVSLGRFGPIDELKLKRPAPATFPADFTRTFGNLQPNLLWRNATLMSDFTVDAPVLESMYTEATGLTVNGVIQVDPAGLGALLTGVGNISDPALGVVDASNIVPLTLNAVYVAFPDRPVRQEFLALVARKAFGNLTAGVIPSLRPLGTSLIQAAAQRHIIVFADDPAVEAAVNNLGAGGAMPGPGVDFTQLTVQNLGGDKLDYYLHSSLSVTGSRPGGGPVGHLRATITLDNRAPANGQPPYIFGPFRKGNPDPPGLYRGLVTLYLPAQSGLRDAQSAGGMASTPRLNTQNGVIAITSFVTIPAGGTSEIVLDVDLAPRPRGAEHFVVVPAPRVNPTETTIALSQTVGS